MAKNDLSKTVKVAITPGKKSLDLIFEKACGPCALKFSRRSKTYSSMEEMNYCGDCATDIRKKYETGKPFEVEAIATEIPVDHLEHRKSQTGLEATHKPIAKTPSEMFLVYTS